MKKIFETPKIEVVKFETEEVMAITPSNNGDLDIGWEE